MPLTPAVRKVWDEHPGYVGAYAINVVTAIYLGVTAITMPGRFNATTYEPLRDSLGIAGWGALIIGYGLALLIASGLRVTVIKAVFFAGGVMYLLIGIWFGTGLVDPRASPWGAIFFSFGVWSLTQMNAYRFAQAEIEARQRAER